LADFIATVPLVQWPAYTKAMAESQLLRSREAPKFMSYSDVVGHRSMVFDGIRNAAYTRALKHVRELAERFS
jgi:hypothetical protein